MSQFVAGQAELDAARLLLDRMGISPADLLEVDHHGRVAPTFAEYVPVVAKAVSDGSRRGVRLVLEPDRAAVGRPAHRRAHPVGDRAAGEHSPAPTWWCAATPEVAGQRRREPHRRIALPVPAGRRRRLSATRPTTRPCKVAKPRRLASTRRAVARRSAGRDQPGRGNHRQRPRPGHPAAPAAHRDRLPARRRARPSTAGPRPGPMPGPAAGEGRARRGGNRSHPP